MKTLLLHRLLQHARNNRVLGDIRIGELWGCQGLTEVRLAPLAASLPKAVLSFILGCIPHNLHRFHQTLPSSFSNQEQHHQYSAMVIFHLPRYHQRDPSFYDKVVSSLCSVGNQVELAELFVLFSLRFSNMGNLLSSQ